MIRSEQPFSLVEQELFAEYIRSSHTPNYEPVTRNTIKSEMFKLYEEHKQVFDRQSILVWAELISGDFPIRLKTHFNR